MLALETMRGIRVVASAGALDAVAWPVGTIVIRTAPDDVLALGATGVPVSDEHAIVESDAGFMGAWLTPEETAARVIPHLEWALPPDRPALAQGLIAGVPAKLWLEADRVLLLCTAAYAHELIDRLNAG